ncbi:MAG: hypothetical protein HYX29_02240 [Solirubrobacterales bacterium]|nr:hypothetical protein [Solirubrobacterales bacterium]
MVTKSFRLLLLTTLALLASVSAAGAAPADLDPSFGSGGVVTLPAIVSSTLIDQGLQSDGKVVFGYERDVDSMPELMRINPDGSVDSSFGTAGKFAPPLAGGTAAEVEAVVPLSTGRILVGGTTTIAAVERMIVWAVTPAGTLDTSFNGGVGYVVFTAVGTDGNATADIGVQPDGDIAVVGSVTIGGIEGAILRLLSSTGVVGASTTKVLSDDMAPTSVAMQANGDIVFGSVAVTPGDTVGVTQRFTAAGVWDATFASSGFALFGFAVPIVSQVYSVLARPDGSLVSLGHVGFASTLQSLGSSGVPSNAIDPFGITRVLGPNSASVFISGALVGNGRTLAVGITTNVGTINSPFVARFEASGALDPTFAAGALAAGSESATASGAAVQADGRYLVTHVVNSTGQLKVARLMGDYVAPPVEPLKVKFKTIKSSQTASKFKKFSGTASGAGLAKVQIAILKVDSKLLKKSKKCKFVKSSSGATKTFKAVNGKCTPSAFLNAKGTTGWSYSLKKSLPPGKYKLYARASGAGGATSSIINKSLTLKK